MSFKSLGDRVRQKAFGLFLSAADSIEGVIITISIDKSLSEPVLFDGEQIKSANSRWCKQKWHFSQLQRMLSVAHFIAFLVAGTTSAGQDLYWISDQDDIFANDKYSYDTGIAFTKFLNAYSRHDYGTISIGTTAIAEGDLLEEDLAAVTDIAAGGTVELLTMIKNTYGIIPSFAVEVPDLPTRTELFWEWFQDQSTNLKKIGCVFEQQAKSLRVKTWR
ncbi:MAG: hypothetical protein KDA57_17600 [Planctomycetales bacterium]|nr:hypothetical protein [Planctomycetales bacterium]